MTYCECSININTNVKAKTSATVVFNIHLMQTHDTASFHVHCKAAEKINAQLLTEMHVMQLTCKPYLQQTFL